MSRSQDISLEYCLRCELAAYPRALFDKEGVMRVTQKCTLKNALQVTVWNRSCPHVDTVVYDVSALLWTIKWLSGTLLSHIDAFKVFVKEAVTV